MKDDERNELTHASQMDTAPQLVLKKKETSLIVDTLSKQDVELDVDVVEVYQMLIKCYEARFPDQEKIPVHRKIDINALNGYLKNPNLTHVELYEEIDRLMKGMKTGWISGGQVQISTGHSELLSYLTDCMSHPSYSREGMQRRDERRERARRRYQQQQQEQRELSGKEVSICEYYELKNQELQTNLGNCEKALNEKRKIVDLQTDRIKVLEKNLKPEHAEKDSRGKRAEVEIDERIDAEDSRLKKHKEKLSGQRANGTFFQKPPGVTNMDDRKTEKVVAQKKEPEKPQASWWWPFM